MNTLKQYIEERIELLGYLKARNDDYGMAIGELQAVLSKIEELEKSDPIKNFAKALERVYSEREKQELNK